MLRALALRDFVIVESLDLELATGFTSLTGETGAGKSILVDALGLVLGSRADPGVIRPGADRADLTAEFDVSGLEPARRWLAANDLEEGEGDACLVRRTIDRAGRSRGFVNGCLLYTSDAADERSSVDLGGRRIIKKKNEEKKKTKRKKKLKHKTKTASTTNI